MITAGPDSGGEVYHGHQRTTSIRIDGIIIIIIIIIIISRPLCPRHMVTYSERVEKHDWQSIVHQHTRGCSWFCTCNA
jgi:hypothetical protein